MILRDYQSLLLDDTRAKIREGVRRILIRLATGGGKTVIAATILGGVASRGLNAWFVVHRKELLDQTSVTFRDVGIEHGFIAAGRPVNPFAKVHLCGVATLAGRLDGLDEPAVIVWDECHHLAAGQWAAIMARYPKALHIGLSATPQRLDGRGLRPYFDVIVNGPSTGELIAAGHLSRFKYFAPGVPDLAGVSTSMGDFNRGDLSNLMDKPKIIGDAVATYQRLAAGERAIMFCVDRAHSRNVAAAFTEAGIRAAHVDGAMPAAERDRLVSAWKAGDIDVMSNVELFGEGVDVPALVYAGLLRPTQSLSLHLQQAGRTLRIMPGKQFAIIADHAGNAFRHGLPDMAREWTLDDRAKRKTGVNDDAMAIRQCPECFRISPATVARCPECDYGFPVRISPIAMQAGELFELEQIVTRERRKQEEKEARTVGELVKLAQSRGYPNPTAWAAGKIKQRQHFAGKFKPGGRFRRTAGNGQ